LLAIVAVVAAVAAVFLGVFKVLSVL